MQRPWTFTLMCPQGHYVTQEGYDQQTLRAALKSGAPLRFYCERCGSSWVADAAQRGMVSWALDQGS